MDGWSDLCFELRLYVVLVIRVRRILGMLYASFINICTNIHSCSIHFPIIHSSFKSVYSFCSREVSIFFFWLYAGAKFVWRASPHRASSILTLPSDLPMC